METSSVERGSASPQPQEALDDATAESPLGSRMSDGPIVTLIACKLALLLMLAA